jgi:hypothetical protein
MKKPSFPPNTLGTEATLSAPAEDPKPSEGTGVDGGSPGEAVVGQPAAVTPAPIKSLAQLDQLLREPRRVTIDFGPEREPLVVEVFRLRPRDAERVAVEMRGAVPDIIKDANGETRYDMTKPGYLEKKREAEVRARAVAVYCGCPLLQEAAPGLRDAREITDFVQGQLTDSVLDALQAAILSEDAAATQRLTGFF